MVIVAWGIVSPAIGAAYFNSVLEAIEPFTSALAVSALIVMCLVGLLEAGMSDTYSQCGEAELDIAHKIAIAKRRKIDLLIVNLCSMR